MFDIDNYFQNFMANNCIFHNRDVLRPEFIPETLPHRDVQIRRIAETVACTLKNSMPSNMFIFGKTGTGKTAVVKQVSEKLNAQLHQLNQPLSKWIFLNCQEVNTGYRVLAKICNSLDSRDEIPIAGWPLDVVFDKLIEKLEENVHGVCFLVLDEIDILVENTQKNADILYNLTRINSRLKHARVNIIGISNVLNFKNKLDPRVLSCLGEEEIIFPAYNAMELNDILQQRAEMAFNLNAVDDDVLPLCGALAAKEHGDARKALDLLRKAGELAERRNAERLTEDHVYLAQDNIEKDKMKEYCEALPLQSKVVLLAQYILQRHRGSQAIITGDLYQCYSELQSIIPGLNLLTQRRVSELVRELDLSGLLNAQLKSQGRKGRTKFISLNVPLTDMYKYLNMDNRFADLLDYRPPSIQQARLTRFTAKSPFQ